MKIRRSSRSDMDEILKLYVKAREFMTIHGNPNQWGKNHPEISLIEQDIDHNNSYVCTDDGKIVGTFMFVEDNDPTYAKIYQGEWINNEPYGVVHRIASAKGKRGVATACLEWCFKKCGNIRIDTHRDNFPMQNLLKKNGFVQCGIIHLKNGDERIAFQKTGRGVDSEALLEH